MHVRIQRGGGVIGDPDPHSWTPPASRENFGLKNPKNKHKNNQRLFSRRWAWTPPPSLTKKSGSVHALTIQPLIPGLTQCQKELYGYVCTLAELSITGGGGGVGGGWNELACSPKIENWFSGVPCSPTFSLFACSPQKVHLPPLFSWNKCPYTLFPKTHGRPHQLLTYTHPQSYSCSYVFIFPSSSPIFFIFAGIILGGPNPFCEKVLLLLENGLYFWLGPI